MLGLQMIDSQTYRNEAEKLRKQAVKMTDSDHKETMLEIARLYGMLRLLRIAKNEAVPVPEFHAAALRMF